MSCCGFRFGAQCAYRYFGVIIRDLGRTNNEGETVKQNGEQGTRNEERATKELFHHEQCTRTPTRSKVGDLTAPVEGSVALGTRRSIHKKHYAPLRSVYKQSVFLNTRSPALADISQRRHPHPRDCSSTACSGRLNDVCSAATRDYGRGSSRGRRGKCERYCLEHTGT